MKRTAATELIPTIYGTPFGGGFLTGRFFIGADAYALITSPRTEGDYEPQVWNNSSKKVAGALSYCDGLANTDAMAKAGSQLAKRIHGLRIGGFKDWYLPSREEQLLQFYNLSTAKGFAKGGAQCLGPTWYWSSTQHASDASYAWSQYFGYGSQDSLGKGYLCRARAVRRIKI